MCTFAIPTMLTFMYLFKLLMLIDSRSQATSNKIFEFPKLDATLAEIQQEGGNLSRFDIMAPPHRDLLKEVISEISSKGIIPSAYYVLLFQFVVFWYFFATLVITSIGMLYYRKFKSVN